MKSPTIFKHIVLLSIFAPIYLYGQAAFPLNPLLNYTNGFTSSNGDLFEIGLSIDLNPTDPTKQESALMKFGVRIPQSKGKTNFASIDKSTDNVLVYLGSEIILINSPGIQKEESIVLWSMEPYLEFGTRKYTYYPDSLTAYPAEVWKNNWALELKSRYFRSTCSLPGAWQWTVFARFRYAVTNTTSDKLYLLMPGNNIVNELVVDEPKTIHSLTPAFGFNVYPGTALPFSFSPVFYYYWLNEDKIAGFEKERLRLEQWLYFYPISDKNAGLRIGIGAFQDLYTAGQQGDAATFGAMINVKVDANIMKSVF
jgi:hypothetical protein